MVGCGQLHLLLGLAGSQRVSLFALHGASGAVFPVGQRDFAVAEIKERLLHDVLELLDVDIQWALAVHTELQLRTHLSPDVFLGPDREAGCADGTLDLVAEPRHDARFAGFVAVLVAADDLREIARGGGRGIVTENEGGCDGGAHGVVGLSVVVKF